MMHCKTVECGGETLELYPQMVAFWPKTQALFVADVHLGKRASRANRGLYTPEGTDNDDLIALRDLAQELDTKHLYILGDLFHDNFALNSVSINAFNEWVARLGVAVSLTLGNHDIKAAGDLSRLNIEILPSGFGLDSFWLTHEPEKKAGFFNICGHLHAGVRVKDAAGCAHKTKAFWWNSDQLVLPAFGITTSMTHVKARKGDIIYACADDRLVALKY